MTDPLDAFKTELRTRKVLWAKYLTEELAHIYQPIVAYMLHRYETSETGWVSAAEVARAVGSLPELVDDVDEATCERYLTTLASWDVVLPEEDVSDATNLDDFLHAPKRYQISEHARRLERAVREIVSERGLRGSLDANRLDRMWKALKTLTERLQPHEAESLSRSDLARVEAAWNECEDLRDQIREQTERYLNDLSVQDDVDAADAEVFRAYREIIRNYINEFLIDLKDFRVRSHTLFQDWHRDRLDERLIQAVIRIQRERKGDDRDETELREVVASHLRILVGFSTPAGDARRLEKKATTRLIALIGQVERIVRQRSTVLDRKHDLERLALALRRAPTDAFARDLIATAFGWSTPRHMTRYELEEHEPSLAASVWETPPWTVELRPARRGNPRFGAAGAVRDRRAERAHLRRRKIEQERAARAFWDRLFPNGTLVLDEVDLSDVVALNRLTRILRDCQRSPNGHTRLDDGSVVRIVFPKDPSRVGQVRAADGVLYTRAYTLVRTVGETS